MDYLAVIDGCINGVEVKTAHDKTALQRQIDATDKQIDRLVYELYDLTDDEIKIVEQGMSGQTSTQT